MPYPQYIASSLVPPQPVRLHEIYLGPAARGAQRKRLRIKYVVYDILQCVIQARIGDGARYPPDPLASLTSAERILCHQRILCGPWALPRRAPCGRTALSWNSGHRPPSISYALAAAYIATGKVCWFPTKYVREPSAASIPARAASALARSSTRPVPLSDTGRTRLMHTRALFKKLMLPAVSTSELGNDSGMVRRAAPASPLSGLAVMATESQALAKRMLAAVLPDTDTMYSSLPDIMPGFCPQHLGVQRPCPVVGERLCQHCCRHRVAASGKHGVCLLCASERRGGREPVGYPCPACPYRGGRLPSTPWNCGLKNG